MTQDTQDTDQVRIELAPAEALDLYQADQDVQGAYQQLVAAEQQYDRVVRAASGLVDSIVEDHGMDPQALSGQRFKLEREGRQVVLVLQPQAPPTNEQAPERAPDAPAPEPVPED